MPQRTHYIWNTQTIKKGVQALKNKEMGYLKIHQQFRVPRSKLEKYLNRKTLVDELILKYFDRNLATTLYEIEIIVAYFQKFLPLLKDWKMYTSVYKLRSQLIPTLYLCSINSIISLNKTSMFVDKCKSFWGWQ